MEYGFSFKKTKMFLQLADGYFSARHYRRAGQIDRPSIMDGVYFRKPDVTLEARKVARSGCTSHFVADQNKAALDNRYDVNGIFGMICRHGIVEHIFGGSNGALPFLRENFSPWFSKEIFDN